MGPNPFEGGGTAARPFDGGGGALPGGGGGREGIALFCASEAAREGLLGLFPAAIALIRSAFCDMARPEFTPPPGGREGGGAGAVGTLGRGGPRGAPAGSAALPAPLWLPLKDS